MPLIFILSGTTLNLCELSRTILAFDCRYVCGAKGVVTMEKEWSPTPVAYPYQLTVKVTAVIMLENTILNQKL